MLISFNAFAQVGSPVNVRDAQTGYKAIVDSNGNLHVISAGGGASVTAAQGAPNTLGNAWPVKLSDGTFNVGSQAHPIFVTVSSGTVSISGVVSVTGPLTDAQLRASAVPVTDSKLDVNLSTRTKPADQQHAIVDSGTTTVTQATGTNLHSVVDSGSITANAGTNLNTSSLELDATAAALNLGQASTTSGQTGPLAQTATTTAAPTYVTAKTNPLSTTTAGALRVDGSGVTQPISGTVTTTPPANASTNVAQFGGTNVSTGTGASGAGIPRVTVSNDSTVTANAGTNLNTSALALDANLTNGTQKAIARGGAKGATTAADVTSTANGADHNGLDVTLMPSTNVVGHVIADTGSTTAVTGNVTVVQPTGTNLHAVVDSGSITATQATGTNLHTVVDSGTITTVTTVTGATISNGAGAAAVNIQDGGNSITVDGTVTTSPPANASTNVAQFGGTNVSTGTGAGGAGIPRVTVSNDSVVGIGAGSAVIGHVIADTGSTTAVTGNVTVTQATGTNLHAVLDSGTVTANQGTANSVANAWPAKITDGTNTATVTAGGLLNVSAPPDTVGSTVAFNALGQNATVAIAGQLSVSFFLAAGTFQGTFIPEVSVDGGTTYVQAYFMDPITAVPSLSASYGVSNPAFSQMILIPGGASHARVRVTSFDGGTANATLRATGQLQTSIVVSGLVNSTGPLYTNGTQAPIALTKFGEIRTSAAPESMNSPANGLNTEQQQRRLLEQILQANKLIVLELEALRSPGQQTKLDDNNDLFGGVR